MTLITIRQNDTTPLQASVSFDHEGQFHFALPEPFNEKDEGIVAWYFEQYINDPAILTQGAKADQARGLIEKYGRSLFDAVFSDRKAFARYQTAVTARQPFTFEIIGSHSFHNWHWEALKDPDQPAPFVLHCSMIRTTINPPVVSYDLPPSPTINLLVVVARPHQYSSTWTQDVAYRTISRPLVESLRQAKVPVQIDFVRPGTYRALVDHLNRVRDEKGKGYYHLLHFDLHGALLTFEQLQEARDLNRFLYHGRYGRNDIPKYSGQKAFLFFEQEDPANYASDPASAEEVANLLQEHAIATVILNACQSGKQVGASETSLGSRLLQSGVQTVLAMSYSVTVTAAKLMMPVLYRHLFDHNNLPQAISAARTSLHNQKDRPARNSATIRLEDWLLPVVYQTGGANRSPNLPLREFTPTESAAYHDAQARRYRATAPTYGFIGRDLDILHIEKRLLAHNDQPHNVLMLRGMGGAGKTTLLHHLGEWWQTTGLVGEVFYFGYDEQAWPLPQILNTIAQRLLNHGPLPVGMQVQPAYNTFLMSSLAAQTEQIARLLRNQRHLLILDNLESVTGELLAIRHTLPPDEQKALRGFLAELRGGQTLVLLGTRGGEGWLTSRGDSRIAQPPALRPDEIYPLPGLDPDSAAQMAEQILQREVKRPERLNRLRQDPDYLRLLKLLNGFPLPMQVLLANLAYQDPAEILAALHAGQVEQLDNTSTSGGFTADDITTSIMRCIDYAHGNLSPNAQTLLLCLAPFTGVIFLAYLEEYTQHLQSRPALATLPFDQWQTVFQEAKKWGLLTDHEIPAYVHIQPILPYFLRGKLATGNPAIRQAIETAYRRHYDNLAGLIRQFMDSQNSRERQIGQMLAGLEYENLTTALDSALAIQISFIHPYMALFDYLDSQHEPDRALDLGQRILGRLENAPAELLAGPLGVERMIVLDHVAKWYLAIKQYSAAQVAYQRKLELVNNLSSLTTEERSKSLANTYHQLGNVAEAQADWVGAETAYRQALALFQEINDRYHQAGTYGQLGILAQKQRDWVRAEAAHRQSLSIFQEFNDRYNQATAYHLLGTVAQEQQDWVRAEATYHQALAIYQEFNDHYGQAATYHQLGILAQKQQSLGKAETAYRQSLAIKQEINDHYSQASTYHQLGMVAQAQQDWAGAEKAYHQALVIYQEFDVRYEQANTYGQIGLLVRAQGQWEEAGAGLLKALALFAEFADQHNMGITFGNLARLWRESGAQAAGNTALPAAVAEVLGWSVAEVVAKMEEALGSE